MMMVLGILIFSGGFGLAGYAILTSILPNLSRIADALGGHPLPQFAPQFAPLATLVHAERRIAVKRRASPGTGRMARWSAAA